MANAPGASPGRPAGFCPTGVFALLDFGHPKSAMVGAWLHQRCLAHATAERLLPCVAQNEDHESHDIDWSLYRQPYHMLPEDWEDEE